MPEVNWDAFAALPGAVTMNFEMLCRALVWRHYGRFGSFRALANQPGVEFHFKLHRPCGLGDAGRWYGWQCKWYGLPAGQAIGATRRGHIEEALAKTAEVLPGLTDWVLCTRHVLTAGDQEWFYALQKHMQLHLWTGAEVAEHLSGPAEILRSTYFGDLVLTPALLRGLHEASVAPIKNRWLPEIHQVVDTERALRSALGAVDAWSRLSSLGERLEAGAGAVTASLPAVPARLHETMTGLVEAAGVLRNSLTHTLEALRRGDYEVLRQELAGCDHPTKAWDVLLRWLRAARHSVSLDVTNLRADMHGAHEALTSLDRAMTKRLVAVVADAGCGKTELAAQLTSATEDRPAGILLHGRDLHAGHGLDALARRVAIHGTPIPTFEALVAAVDAAGQRVGRRLPIVIDGLNEAEDPRDWKGALAALHVVLQQYPYVLVVCTLRPAFIEESLPDDVDQLEMAGFEHDVLEAVRRYFQHYRIDPADARLPWRLLDHPLTLRMFCEVTNPTCERTVGVEAMPSSLTALFDRYLEQVGERIGQLAPRAWRYYEPDVRTALNSIGLALWETNARSIDVRAIRVRLGDDPKPWDASIVRALEQDGVLIRVPGDQPSADHVAVVHDALAGHLVADALLDRFGGGDFESWLQSAATKSAITGSVSEGHPLATDIFRGLVGLSPRRRYRRQLWPLLDEPARTEALCEAAWLEAAFLDGDTVLELTKLVLAAPTGRRELLDRLWSTRAARSHPLDAEFLDSVLRPMSVPDRDLHWTEWVRRNQGEVIKDLQRLEDRWRKIQPGHSGDRLRARWAMWTLTSTVRSLRDQATRALYRFGCMDPSALFDLAAESLEVNDPYVPERMLAASYGVVMALWADPRGEQLRAVLPAFANVLVDRMFVSGAPNSTRHVLMRDSAAGIVALALRVSQGSISEEKLRYLRPPCEHLPSPFPEATAIKDADVAEARMVIGMDFGNYTIGRLIPDRRNYDHDSPTYKDVRRQIDARIVALGYSSSRFAEIDRGIAEDAWRSERRGFPRTDRYGKKYSWIAYFEMYGLRLDEGKLPEWCAGERTPDVDIDPSFPEPVHKWAPSLPDPFADSPTEPLAWIAAGPTPNYDHLLNPREVDGKHGPWALLEGYIEQSATTDDRRIFTLLRGVFVVVDQLPGLLARFDSVAYPGNLAIPEPQEDHYTYAGEISWSGRYGSNLRGAGGEAQPDRREAFAYHDGTRWQPGIPIEVPVCRFGWESYHSELNQVSGIILPAPALCERLRLSNHQGEWDLYDPAGKVATMYREFKGNHDTFDSHLSYIRSDLLAEYLMESAQTLVWLIWGEREFHHRTALGQMDELRDPFSRYQHIHRRRVTYVSEKDSHDIQ